MSFQSTLPLRGATPSDSTSGQQQTYFNPRSPCGERRRTHRKSRMLPVFQSTLPLRGATSTPGSFLLILCISIHAPLAGSDIRMRSTRPIPTYFNPRSPCGERLASYPMQGRFHVISIHAPLAGSDPCGPARHLQPPISIHAPLAGSDSHGHVHRESTVQFQSTLPLRGATSSCSRDVPLHEFQSTLPLRGATWPPRCSATNFLHFNPRSPCGERRGRRSTVTCF